MNKTFKFVIITGIILILLGGLVYGAAYALGERHLSASSVSVDIQSFEKSEADNLKLDIGAARLNIKKTHENEFQIEAQYVLEGQFNAEISGGTLMVSYNPKLSSFLSIGNISVLGITSANKTEAVITIYIPEGTVFKNAEINGGVGEYSIEYLNAEKLKFNGGIGEYNIHGDFGELDINAGIGIIKLTGSIERDISINGGVGEIKLDMAGDLNNYNVTVNGGIGGVTINGDTSRSNPDAPYKLTVSGGVGSIDININ
ncbi:MAG: DUF4097 domain-containing protein [Oscillospiraceae bacterium]|nr:DUF4097 domain-containing protein [Oscillospiraceae bacterium]